MFQGIDGIQCLKVVLTNQIRNRESLKKRKLLKKIFYTGTFHKYLLFTRKML